MLSKILSNMLRAIYIRIPFCFLCFDQSIEFLTFWSISLKLNTLNRDPFHENLKFGGEFKFFSLNFDNI